MTRITPATAVLLLGVLAIFAVILGSCHSGSHRPDVSTASVVYRGDLDGDGLPSVGDAIGILRIVVGLDAQNPIADADGDGSTTVNDAIAVLRCVVGLDDWPLGVMNGAPTRTIGPGTVNEGDFVIGAGERVECVGDTIIECTTATIAGELFSPSPSNAGESAGSITIQAQGDVLLTGAMRAGNGSDGDLSTSSGQGGDGGSVTINSANGDITIGAEVATSSAGPDSYLGAGDAGVGADDLTTAVPGAGGQGGSVSLSCPNGLLTIHPRAGLIHIGNGGDGGAGHIPADSDAELRDAVDDGSDGGASGLLSTEANGLRGVEEEDGALPIDPPNLLTGGNGGDGGSLWLGVAVGTDPDDIGVAALLSTRRSGAVRPMHAGRQGPTGVAPADGEAVVYLAGGPGGDAVFPGWPGQGGWGHNIDAPGPYSAAAGGLGGNLRFNLHISSGGVVTPWVSGDPDELYRGGTGGQAWATGSPDIPQGPLGPCQDGVDGQSAFAWGGAGGVVVVDNIPPRWLDRMTIYGGRGGSANASAGYGGRAGHCCDPVSAGKRGGNAGPVVEAVGGRGGDQPHGGGGDGGNARASGRSGGDGGNGSPPGSGGSATQVVRATGGQPGTGNPPAEEGEVWTSNENPGNPGKLCPTTVTHGVVTSNSPQRTVYGHRGFYTTETYTDQVQPSFSLGGTNFPVIAWVGQSMIFSPDNSRLWVGNELGGMCLYRNPFTDSGDRAPDLELHMPGMQWYSIWYEAQADTLYATTTSDGFIYAWDNASQGNANRAPDRSIEVPGYHKEGYLTGAPGSGVLFLVTRLYTHQRVLVFRDAAQLDGFHAADRYWIPGTIPAAFAHALSWDQTRDLLYVGVPNLNQIQVFSEASTRHNVGEAATPERVITIDYPGMASHDWITGVIVVPEQDLLFVSMYLGQTMVFTGASTLQGSPEPARREQLGTMALGLGVFRQ